MVSDQEQDREALARELHGDAEQPVAKDCGECNHWAAKFLASDWLAEVVRQAEQRGGDEGIRQAVEWLRADYPYGTGPEWRENGCEWIEQRATEDRLARHAGTDQ